MSIILTIQTKGGVGKSTIAQQVLSTYFLANRESVSLVEIDDENLDSAYLKDSRIKTEQLTLGSSASAERVIEALTERVSENLVIDVGGNRTATNFIDAAGRAGFFSFVDLVVIPISGPGQDEINALKTIDLINEVSPETKIVIAVTRQMVRSDDEFNDVFRRYFNVDALEKAADGICYFPQVMAMIHARFLGMTLYEMVEIRDELLTDLSDRMVTAAKGGNKESAVGLSRVRSSVHESKDILPFITGCHQVIASVL